MTTLILGALLAGAAATLATIAGWLAAALSSRWLQTCSGIPAPTRVVLLAQARLLPLAAVVILVASQIRAFLSYEAARAESAGPLLIAIGLAGLFMCCSAAWRGVTGWRDTALIVDAWQRSGRACSIDEWSRPAWAIAVRSPVVAVVGALRPQLFIARQVIDACTPDELAAIVAHESAHVASRDNLVRLLFRITPGARLFARIAEPLEQAWQAAAEQAADLAAGRSAGGLELASALTKVARLAGPPAPAMTPASTLMSDSDLPSRIRRLLEESVCAERHRASWLPAAIGIAIAALAQAPPMAMRVHELFERLVRHS